MIGKAARPLRRPAVARCSAASRALRGVKRRRGLPHALEALVEKIVPGRWADARQPSEKELRATALLRLPLEEASAKVRSGPPIDDDEDLGLPVWAGVVDMRTVLEPPRPDAQLGSAIQPPAYLEELLAARGGSAVERSNQAP